MVQRRISEAEADKIVDFGAFSYLPDKMAAVLDWPIEEIREMYADPCGEFRKLYDKGVHMADYVLDKKLFELASKGDLKAIEKFQLKRRRAR